MENSTDDNNNSDCSNSKLLINSGTQLGYIVQKYILGTSEYV